MERLNEESGILKIYVVLMFSKLLFWTVWATSTIKNNLTLSWHQIEPQQQIQLRFQLNYTTVSQIDIALTLNKMEP